MRAIQQAFLNIINNAIQAIKSSGKLIISTSIISINNKEFIEVFSNAGQSVGLIDGISVDSAGSVYIVNNKFVNRPGGNSLERSNLGEVQFRKLGDFFLKTDGVLAECSLAFNGDFTDCS